ncbi:MAG TPA: glutamate--cysteine ligase [Pseudomonadales bacterium]|nr:glutamate--cysteine ligase [Pseudomonadales bacterium]
MTATFTHRLQALQNTHAADSLRGMRRGLEKESLRVTPGGKLAQTPHFAELGSALKHSSITTDFSEALLEFITPACSSIGEALDWLERIHAFTYSVLQKHDEKLWVASMPCALEGDNTIPIAQYGSTHAARMKTVYREGLGHRYGRLMQTIAGIHYNVSFPDTFWQLLQAQENVQVLRALSLQDYKTQRYFDLIRNFRRHIWLLMYLFGASPAVCPTFVQGRAHQLQSFDAKNRSLFLPHATSLRMGNLGYQSNAQSALMVCYNSLPSYIRTLKKGLTEKHPAYEKIGLRDAQGNYLQLSTNLLQIENEFYSTIRPKRVTRSGETPILALHENGVEYVEVRCLDLNPYLPTGIDSDTAHFIEAFLLWCLLRESPSTDEAEYARMTRNQTRIVERGREPGLLLEDAGGERDMQDWAATIFGEIAACAQLLDQANSSNAYMASMDVQRAKLHDSSLTPSARLLRDMQAQDLSFFRLACNLSAQNAEYYAQVGVPAEQQHYFAEEARQSIAAQQALEQQAPLLSFEQFLQNYYSQYEKV